MRETLTRSNEPTHSLESAEHTDLDVSVGIGASLGADKLTLGSSAEAKLRQDAEWASNAAKDDFRRADGGTLILSENFPGVTIQAIRDVFITGEAQYLGRGTCCEAFRLEVSGQEFVLKIAGGKMRRDIPGELGFEVSSLNLWRENKSLILSSQYEQSSVSEAETGVSDRASKGSQYSPLPSYLGTIVDEENVPVMVIEEYVKGPKLGDLIRQGMIDPGVAIDGIGKLVSNIYERGLGFWDIDIQNIRLSEKTGELVCVDAASFVPKLEAPYPAYEVYQKLCNSVKEYSDRCQE